MHHRQVLLKDGRAVFFRVLAPVQTLRFIFLVVRLGKVSVKGARC
jgi:hypothetical protein